MSAVVSFEDFAKAGVGRVYPCEICSSPYRADIEAARDTPKGSFPAIAKWCKDQLGLKVSESRVRTHLKNHV